MVLSLLPRNISVTDGGLSSLAILSVEHNPAQKANHEETIKTFSEIRANKSRGAKPSPRQIAVIENL